VKGLGLRERAFWLFYLAEALLTGRWMKQRKLEHLHVHFGGAVAAVGMLTSIAWKIPYSLTIHGPEELLNPESYRLKAKLAQAKFVFCISDFCRSQLYALTPPSEWEKFSVIRLGVDPLVLTPSRPGNFSLRGDVPRLVCTGRMVAAKGHVILLEAVKLLRERGVHLQLILIGGGPELGSLQDFVRTNHLSDTVSFTQALSHPQTLAHLRRADLFALASFAEGIPVALMEAMSLGLPCVSTTIAGIPELIRNGIDGLLVPPANAMALANALETVIGDHGLRRSLGASARQRIINQYNLPLNQELLAHMFRLKTGRAEGPDEAGPAA
jgi:colanic acid/amylovoran biosynthesis glycosyltransferase